MTGMQHRHRVGSFEELRGLSGKVVFFNGSLLEGLTGDNETRFSMNALYVFDQGNGRHSFIVRDDEDRGIAVVCERDSDLAAAFLFSAGGVSYNRDYEGAEQNVEYHPRGTLSYSDLDGKLKGVGL